MLIGIVIESLIFKRSSHVEEVLFEVLQNFPDEFKNSAMTFETNERKLISDILTKLATENQDSSIMLKSFV